MTSPDLTTSTPLSISADNAGTLSYQPPTPPILRHPLLASVGFLLFGFSFLCPFIVATLEDITTGALPQWFGEDAFFCEYILRSLGSILVVGAFRRSPLLSLPLRATLFVAILTQGLLVFFGIPLAAAVRHAFAIFAGPSMGSALVATINFTEEFTLLLFSILWLLLLWRLGEAIRSLPFRLFAAVVLGAQILMVATGFLFFFFYFQTTPLQQAPLFSILSNRIYTELLMFILSLCCIAAVRRISRMVATTA